MFPKKISAFFPILLLSICLPAHAQQVTTTPVAIIVKDPSGTTVAHAQVRIVPAPYPTTRVETDDKGRVTFDLRPGGYAVLVRQSGFKSSATHIDVRAAKALQVFTVDLQLASTGSPTVSPVSAKDKLLVSAYPYHDPIWFSYTELKAMPRATISVHNPHTDADEIYTGVELANLLSTVGAPIGKELFGEALSYYLVATGSDGYSAVLALAEVDPGFHPGEVIIADTMNGKPLDDHSGPLKLVVSEDKRPARWVRNLTTIELKPAQ